MSNALLRRANAHAADRYAARPGTSRAERQRMSNGSNVAGPVVVGVVAYLAVLAAILFFALRWSRRIMEGKLAGTRAALQGLGGRETGQGERGGLYTGTESRWDVGGREVFIKAYYVSRDFVRVNLRLAAGPLPWIVAYPEGAVERFGKKIGLNREVQLGDPTFDDAVYLDTIDTDEQVKRALASPDVRRLILELIGFGYKVQLSARGVEAYQIVYAMSAPDTSHVHEMIPRLAQLAQSVPSFAGETLRKPPLVQTAVLAFIVACVAGGGVMGAIRNSAPAHTLDPAHQAVAFIGVGGALWLLAMIGVIAAMRGRSNAFRVVLIAAAMGLFTLPLTGGVLSLVINQKLDHSPAENHEVTIRRLARKGREVTVTSWRAGRDFETTTAVYTLFNTLKVGDHVIVSEHPGALGWAWTEVVDKRSTTAP